MDKVFQSNFIKKLFKDKRHAVLNILIVVFAAVFAVSAIMLLSGQKEYEEGKETYSEIAESAVIPVAPVSPPANSSEAESVPQIDLSVSPITVDFDKLKKINPDVVAWIYCHDTPINYPIVKTENEQDYDYYLTHTLNGKQNSAGTVFADYRNQSFLEDINTFLYGHSMKNGTMFAYTLRYRTQAFYDTHPYFWIYTPDATYRVAVIAGHHVSPKDSAYNLLTSKDELQGYIQRAVSGSAFKTNADLAGVEKIIQLSACSYNTDDERFLLVGSVEKYN